MDTIKQDQLLALEKTQEDHKHIPVMRQYLDLEAKSMMHRSFAVINK